MQDTLKERSRRVRITGKRDRRPAHRRLRAAGLCLFIASAHIVAAPAVGQQGDAAQAKASIHLGVFVTDRQSTTRLDTNGVRGTDIDLEGDLGLDRSITVARIGGHYALTRRQRLDFSVFDLSRDATNAIDRTIRFGDQTFMVNTVVNTESDLTIFKASYAFLPIVNARGALGLSAGLYTAFTKLTLQELSGAGFESEDLTAPLPVIGVQGHFDLTDRVTLRASVEWFRFGSGDVDGRFRDAYVGGDYSLNDRWSLGLAYNEVSMSLDADESGGFLGSLDWGYDGLLLYLRRDF